jgi:hypothetical protein
MGGPPVWELTTLNVKRNITYGLEGFLGRKFA